MLKVFCHCFPECPKLKQPRNGKRKCRKFAGKMLCIMSCGEGHAFSAKATTMYGCGPDTDWKWNGKDDLTIPSCASTQCKCIL